MVSWRTKRKLIYFSYITAIALVVAVAGIFYFQSRPGTCFDGKQNNGELGIDCGGECARLCPFQVSEPIVHWARALPVRGDMYDAVAFLENPNFDAGARSIQYTFKLYDAQNVLTGERTGATFLNPAEQFVVYESGIQAGTGPRAPRRTFFEFDEKKVSWEGISGAQKGSIIARNTILEPPRDGSGAPRVKTTLINRTSLELRNIEVAALLLDKDGNLLNASKSVVSRLSAGEERTIMILLSPDASLSPSRIDIFTRWNQWK